MVQTRAAGARGVCALQAQCNSAARGLTLAGWRSSPNPALARRAAEREVVRVRTEHLWFPFLAGECLDWSTLENECAILGQHLSRLCAC